MGRAPAPVLLSLIIACGGGGSSSSDTDGGTEPAPWPEIELDLPDQRPCPDGWREVTDSGALLCSPWPQTGTQECNDGFYHLPGTSECARVGTTCAADGWPVVDPPATGKLIYVKEGGIGFGSQETPYATIGAALIAALPGDTIVVGPGDYAKLSIQKNDIAVIGTCPEQVSIDEVSIGGSDISIRNVTILSDGNESVLLSNTGLVLEDVIVRGGTYGIRATNNGTARLESCLVTQTATYGVWAQAGSTVTVAHSAFRDNTGTALRASGPSSYLNVSQTNIHNQQPSSSCIAGGISLDNGATGVLDAIAIDGAYGTALSVARGIVLDAPAVPASAVANHLFIANSYADEELAATLCDGALAMGAAITAWDSTLEIYDSTAQANYTAGLLAFAGAQVELEDVMVALTDSDLETREYGRGLSIEGASLAGNRLAIVANRDVGMFVRGASGAAELSNMLIANTMEQRCVDSESCTRDATASLSVVEGAAAVIDRFRLADSALIGVQQASGGSIMLSDGAVHGNPIASNIQDADYPLETLQDNVLWVDNVTALDAEQLSVPQPLEPLDEL